MSEITNAVATPVENEVVDQITEAVKAPETKEAVKVEAPKEPVSTKKKYKIKVDKNEEEFEFDPYNDEEVTKHLQKSRAADKRFAEAAEVRKAAIEFITELKKNPRKVLADPEIGVDVRKMAEEILNEEIAELEKTPEQKEKEKLQKELEDLRKKAKDQEENAKKAEFSRMQAEAEKQLDIDITAALDISGMPKTAKTVARMAELMIIAMKNGIDLSARDVAPIAKNNTVSEFKELVSSFSDDQLEDFLGKEVLTRLRKKNIAKAKLADNVSSIKSTGADVKKKTPETPTKKMTIREFLKV